MTRAEPMSPKEPALPAARTRRGPVVDAVMVGTALTMLSAVGYTASNIELRHVARAGDVSWALWVACIKAAPSAAVAWLLIGLRAWRGLPALPPRGVVLPLVLTGLFMQAGGNGLFQWALGLVGLAVTVPLTFATLIGTGAVLGRLWLGEPITGRSLLAMGVLIGSIVLLSIGAGEAELPRGIPAWQMAAAVAAACLSGLAFGTSGVVIRRTVTRDVSLSATLMVLSLSAMTGLGLVSLSTLGPQTLIDTPPDDMRAMWAAGIFNAAAFFAVSGALKRIPVVRVNLVNASQIALCGTAGVIWFDEPLTGWLLAGIALTIAGLGLMERP